ncbi:MAG: nitroreductase [Candidatus Edwardsbacteria bacterium RIFOXYD12_FULL_50_11]|uniref:Nitroreductase n=1 Tax=Candidatus Edwardsbacteria bacterium GWF2_54_11 TaxID=1817851 RepID=A0A1F5RIF9_9BACT|nr:MAG: nitroreductase [Candidatus Edwardsbacteria bacterium RifOxyC12_full_54_24]OGF07260.1 MAG: nitroreductase [Candidatus Edwardsbacteria bacterium RifOxyA12_full_54_48]OGF09515.1 MAG: nitroreductase [Candidatus Edwardsbacteria bacterium GWE2_54_12]OGF14287.1 MAG: nitroreductase [Candidatus Edwardsbacteria bacterium GWF2_54_11]OGF17220.1 MAG: nitroreductase [Candidatus Edwardsbacteria bacterium RIFOXYD12_FULL_50_11]OGJ18367.1 MAG: nitroreductase [Candidatus Edwardsbacteria bacterium RifOxyB
MLKDIILKNRSYRRFDQDHRIDLPTLRELAELARLSGSAGNLQPLKYILVSNIDTNEKIFPFMAWAKYLKDWNGPAQGQRPSAYMIMLWDTSVCPSKLHYDAGICAQSILLGAVEKGLGGCLLASVDREGLRKALEIDEQYEIPLVIALGKPAETVVIDDVAVNGSIKYWRDDKQAHHVPKRSLSEMIIKEY